ncbi:MAG: asparagine synthase-related protein [Hyphomicrobium sp.]|uniref:asparagine synthase-related protein n=1 Tax=Hyphomicrobium sp. TaxID=82 RepID=UPI003D0A2244
MAAALSREASSVSGTYIAADQGVGVGWVAHEGAFASAMPVWNSRRDVCLVLTGEDFMDPAELRRLVPGPADQAGPAYLLSLYEALGPGFVAHMNGTFAGVLIDLRSKTTLLFNDRFGLSRINIHQAADRLTFASEAKALLAVLPETRTLDMTAVADTFACGSALQGRTMFQGVSQLPPASLWSIGPDGALRKATYFQPDVWEHQAELPAAEFDERLQETFARILPRYLRGPRPVAMSLTGGLDGRMVMAWARKAPRELPCYTFGGPYRDCADVKLARAIAGICRQPHRTIPVGDAFLDAFPALAEEAVAVSDGTMDVTGAVELYVNRLARDIAPVRLTGNYGSEIVRSNVAFRPARPHLAMLAPEFARLVEASGAAYQAERAGPPLSFIAFKQVPWHHYARASVEQSVLTLRSPFLDNELVALMFRAPAGLSEGIDPSLRLIDAGNPALARLPTDRGLVHGSASVWAKLRRRWIDLTVKAEYAYDYGMPQSVARVDHLLRPLHLERLFLGRHKFYHFRVWYRDRLAGFVKDVLLDPRALGRSYIDGGELERMVIAHTRGEQNWTKEVHRALTLELLQRRLIERS